MIQTTEPRNAVGRREDPTVRFVEDFVRVDATTLAKARNGRVGDVPSATIQLSWTHFGQPGTRTITLPVTYSKQPFGGRRAWWRCPFCKRRCGVLLAPETDGQFACRTCWCATYLSDHPGRVRRHQLVDLLMCGAWGRWPLQEAADALTAPRKRGVRRGRRVGQRAARKQIELWRFWTSGPGLLKDHRQLL